MTAGLHNYAGSEWGRVAINKATGRGRGGWGEASLRRKSPVGGGGRPHWGERASGDFRVYTLAEEGVP